MSVHGIMNTSGLLQEFTCLNKGDTGHSRTPDRDFCCFSHVRLSHIPVPVLWKDKERTAACRPQAGRTSISDVIVMLK